MWKRTFLILFFSSLYGGLYAQEQSPLRVESNIWALKFYEKDSSEYKLSELIPLFENRDRKALTLIRKANNQHDLATFCQISGVFLALYPVISETIGREPNYVMSAIGIGLIGISVPLEIQSRRKATQAVMLYNSSLAAKPQASLQISPLGLGFKLKF
ncbi:MAG: hypothetical protein NXI09_00985 [Bacteroidetes bacterium]|nr:hypothetical protein [Bacteroidota bacterium]